MSISETRPAQQSQQTPHRLTIEERRRLEVTGVQEVVRFDENAVMLSTVKGMLLIQGENLRLQTLLPDGGCVTVTGTISAAGYAQPHERGGFFRRLLG